ALIKQSFMRKSFTHKLNPFKDFLLKDKHIPPYAILFADVLIVFFSFSLSFLIVGGFGFKELDLNQYVQYTAIFCLTALPVIYYGRLHTGLLRFSNTMDLFRIFVVTLLFSILFLTLILLFGQRLTNGNYAPLMLTLLVNFFITASVLMAFRLLAKSVYLILARQMSKKRIHRVLIYGSDNNAVFVKQALSNDQEINYVVEGFISTDRSMLNSYLEQKKVYHIKDLAMLKRKKNIEELVIVNEDLDERDKRDRKSVVQG